LKCARHPEEVSEHKCVLCGKPVCYICGRMISEGTFLCVDCYEKSGVRMQWKGKRPRLSIKPNEQQIVLGLFAIIVVLGSALRFYDLSYKSLWLDEIVSIESSEKYSIMQLIQKFDARLPPFYHIVLHFFLYLGNNEFAARLPSVIFGILAILLIYKVGALFFGRREALISSFLLSISTMHIQYSQEARMYSLATFLSLSSIYLFYKALEEGDIRMWVGFIVSTLLCIFTHYYLLFIALIQMPLFVFLLLKNRGLLIARIQKAGKKKIFMLVLSLMIIFALASPALRAEYTAILGSLRTGKAFDVPWGLKPTPSFFIDLFDHFNSIQFMPWALRDWREPIFYMFLLILFCGLLASIKEYSKPAALLISWIFLPTITVFILSLSLGKPIAAPHYMIFILPGYLIGVSKGISCIADSLSRWLNFLSIGLPERKQIISFVIVTVVFFGVNVFPLQQYYVWEGNENWRAAAKYLETNSSAGDTILVEPEYTLRCLLYYYHPDSEETNVMSTYGSLSEIENISSRQSRLFFVYSQHAVNIDPEGKIRDWLRNNYMEIKRFQGITIYYHQEGLILVHTKDMHFIGLDSPPNEPKAEFWHNNDSATLKVHISKSANYTIAIYAKSILKSALELSIDGASQGIKTFLADDWSCVELGTLYLESGPHEIKIINREGNGLGDTNVIFDVLALYPSS